MAGGDDREFLLSVFLMEAWDTLATIEQRLGQPVTGTVLENLRVVTHRLRGAAALNGFPGVSALASAMEERVEGLIAPEDSVREHARSALDGLVTALQQTLDGIGATGQEDGHAIAGALALHAAKPAIAVTPALTTGSDREALAELDGWFASNGDVLEYFVPEATEHLDTMGHSLLALERDGISDGEEARLFRAVHTLKGAAYTVGCRVIGALAHRLEDLLGQVREGRRTLDQPALDVVNAGLDALRFLVGSADAAPAGRASAFARASQLLDVSMGGATATPGSTPLAVAAPEAAPRAPIASAAGTDAPASGAVRPNIRVNLDRLDALMNLIGELTIVRGRLERRLGQLERVGDLLLFTQGRMRSTVEEFEAKYGEPDLRPTTPQPAGAPANGHLAEPGPGPLDEIFGELEFDRYDDFNILTRSLGEIAADVTESQSQLAALVRGVREEVDRVQQLSTVLRAEVARARMVPMSRFFTRFGRQVRETARTTGKEVILETHGDRVEVDSAIIDQVSDPLLHLIQNAVVHGLEPPDERRAAGKPLQGRVCLSAAHKGGALHLEVEDDGRGIDLAAIRAAAVRGGFVSDSAVAGLGDRDVFDLMFLPGLSTVASVSTVAGRGVGMDVVRTNVGRLGGEVDVESTPGRGTRFTLKLPLTVAISDVLLVRVGDQTLAIPVQAVKVMTRIRIESVLTEADNEIVEIEGERLDFVRLDRALGIAGARGGSVLPVIALRTGRRAIAVAVEEVLGREEIVVKQQGAFLEGVGPFSGATVSAEGRVILLLDPVRLAERRGAATSGRTAVVTATSTPPRSSGRTVLLVDDSVSVRKFVGQMLVRAGFRVVTANDGIGALEQVAEIVVDVVVTDLEMPRLNGYELIRDLRRRPATREVPIVVLTTRTGDKHVRLASQLGVEHYVTKPVDEQAFVRLIEALALEAAMVNT